MQRHTRRWQYLLAGTVLILIVAAGCYQQVGGGSLQSTPVSQALPSPTPFPTDTPPPPPTETPTPTPEPETLGQGGALIEETEEAFLFSPPTEVALAQVIDPNDPIAQTATTEYLLQTEPLFVTATAVVLGATQTVEALLTGTAQLIFPPTETPTPTPTTGGVTGPVIGGADCIHEVRVEDRNLYRISLAYGLTVHDIALANGITNVNLIVVGQKLVIPRCGTTGIVPPPTSTATGGTSPTSGGTTVGGRIHIVRQGETLFEISLLYGVPVVDIAAANGITNINLIYINQELVIP